MKRFIEKCWMRRAIGVCESDDSTIVTEVKSYRLGSMSVVQKEYPNGGAHGPETIAMALKEHLAGRAGANFTVGVAVPGKICYCMSREKPTENKDQSTGEDSDLSGVLRTAMAQKPDQYVISRRSAAFNSRQFNTVVACGRKPIEAIGSAISKEIPTLSVLPLIQPVPWAVVTATIARYKPPKTTKPWIHLHLDRDVGLAILMNRAQPLGWREFNVPTTPSAVPVAARQAVLRLRTHAKGSLGMDPPDVICVEGVPAMAADTAADLEANNFTVIKREQPATYGKDASLGVALAGLNTLGGTLDLAESLRPPARLRDIIPWGAVAWSSFLITLLWFAAHSHLTTLQKTRDQLQKDAHGKIQSLALANLNVDNVDDKLKKRLQELTTQMKAYTEFVQNRETLSVWLEAMPQWIPTMTHITGFSASTTGPWSVITEKRTLTMNCISDVETIRGLPAEIPQMMATLRSQPLLKKRFPDIQLASVNFHGGDIGQMAYVFICQGKCEKSAVDLTSKTRNKD